MESTPGGVGGAENATEAGSAAAPAAKKSRPQGSENASSSALHWLADLASQKTKEDVKGQWNFQQEVKC